MLALRTSTQFRKDYKRMKKQGRNLRLLEQVIDTLLAQKPLEARFRDHALTGVYQGFRECHILPDWLLIYIVDDEELILTAIRTGTHSDLFNE